MGDTAAVSGDMAGVTSQSPSSHGLLFKPWFY